MYGPFMFLCTYAHGEWPKDVEDNWLLAPVGLISLGVAYTRVPGCSSLVIWSMATQTSSRGDRIFATHAAYRCWPDPDSLWSPLMLFRTTVHVIALLGLFVLGSTMIRTNSSLEVAMELAPARLHVPVQFLGDHLNLIGIQKSRTILTGRGRYSCVRPRLWRRLLRDRLHRLELAVRLSRTVPSCLARTVLEHR